MGDYVVPSQVYPLDQAVYVDGGPGASAWGRRIIQTDRALHANLGQVVVNEAYQAISEDGLPDANHIYDKLRIGLRHFSATQGRRTLRYWVRATIDNGQNVLIFPETAHWAGREMAGSGGYGQNLLGTGAEATYGPFTVPIRGGVEEFFDLHFELVMPDLSDPAGLLGNPVTGILAGPVIVDGTGPFQVAGVPWAPFTRIIRLVEPDLDELTRWYWVQEVRNASTEAVPFGAPSPGDQWRAVTGTVANRWQAVVPAQARLHTVYALEDVLTTENEITGS